MLFTRLEHRFVTHIPREMQPGVLYISMEYATAMHLCCCGCGEQVVTPLTPTDWRLTYDGETISLWPSIGNWNFACRSHYIIRNSEVRRAFAWSDRYIARNRERDQAAKERYFAMQSAPIPPKVPSRRRPR
jgi:Family of unknown function (DUF6527)